MPKKAPSNKFTDKQKRFCEEYVKDLNATQAAIRAGYAKDPASAGVIGWENLRKLKIREHIDQLLAELSLSSPETLKSISDIARGDLKDYFSIRQETRTPKVRILLSEYIERLKEEIDTAQYIHEIALAQELLGSGKVLEKATAMHERHIQMLKLALIPHEVRVAKDPTATIIINGETELIDVAELDIARLVRDKEAGKIKSYQANANGVKVELYHADEALRDLAKHHGLFEKDHKLEVDHTTAGQPITQKGPDLSQLTDEELRIRAAIDRKVYGGT